MPVLSVTVRKSQVAQEDLQVHPEHASCDPDFLRAVGCVVGQQVLVRRSDDAFAAYTLSEARDERPSNVVRMGLTGRGRLGGDDQFGAVVDPVVVDRTASDTEARDAGHLVERLDGDRSRRRFIAIAPHGGDIEQHTDKEAERVARSLADIGASCWRCKGWAEAGGASSRWHITSTDIHPASFPLLATLATRPFTHAVAFHGFDDENRPEDVVIGGAGSMSLKRRLHTTISRAVGPEFRVEIASPGDPLGGEDLDNLVNRLTRNRRNGIQLEQSVRARARRWHEIADAVSTVYRARFRA